MKKRLPVHDLIRMIMRISIYQLLLLTIFTHVTFATTGKAQKVLEKKISLQARQETIDRVLSAIGKQAKVKFLYSSNMIQSARRVNCIAADRMLGTVLDSL